MSNSRPVCHSLPFIGSSIDKAPEYSLEKAFSRLTKRPGLDVTYSPCRTEDIIISLGVAKEKAASIQALASTLYLAAQGGEIAPELIRNNALALANLASDTVEEIGEAQEFIKKDIKEALGEKIE